jgi:hypothetical protein
MAEKSSWDQANIPNYQRLLSLTVLPLNYFMSYRWWRDGEEIDGLWSWYRLSSSDNQRTLRVKKLTDKTVGRCITVNKSLGVQLTFSRVV